MTQAHFASWNRISFRSLVFITLLISACSESATAPERTTRLPALRIPNKSYIVNGDEFTVYDGYGNWVKLNTNTHQLITSASSVAVDLDADQQLMYLNAFAETAVSEDAADAIDNLPPVCGGDNNPCPTDMGVIRDPFAGAPLGSATFGAAPLPSADGTTWTTSKPKKSKDGLFGFEVIFDPQTQKKVPHGTATMFSWPPNCSASYTELQNKKLDFRAKRMDYFNGLYVWLRDNVLSVPAGKPSITYSDLANLGVAVDHLLFYKASMIPLATNGAIYNLACGPLGNPTVQQPLTIRFGPQGGAGPFGAKIYCMETVGWVVLYGEYFRAQIWNCEYAQT